MSDRGTEFSNAIIMELSEILSIKKVYTSAYRPLANGATERIHCFFNDSMSMYVSKFAREWDIWLHAATFVHNTSVISGTDNPTPFFLVYGRHAIMPNDAALAPLPTLPGDQLTYAQELLSGLARARETFSSITKEVKTKCKEYYDLSRKFQTFQVNDYVLVKRPPHLSKGHNDLVLKWLPKSDGPYHIIENVKDSDNYRLVHAYTEKQLDPTNVDKLIRVGPWAIDNYNNAPNVDNEDQPDQSQQPDPRHPALGPSDDTEADFSVGDLVVFEQQGSDILSDDDIRTMIIILYNWLLASPSKQAPTSELASICIVVIRLIRNFSKVSEASSNYYITLPQSNFFLNRQQAVTILFV